MAALRRSKRRRNPCQWRFASKAGDLNHPAGTSNLLVMAELTDSNVESAPEIEQMTRGDHLFQILCGVGIASGLALLWTMESIRNLTFRVLNALHIPARRHKRGSAFPAGPRPA
jgi:hypothetical protein